MWIKAVTNHLYWIAASTPGGDGEQMAAKFNSLIDHVVNIHDGGWHGRTPCSHGTLEEGDLTKYFKPGDAKIIAF